MRIAIATDWFAPRRGGIESQLQQLCTGLAGRGHDVSVLTSTPGAVDGDGYTVRPVGRLPFAALPLALSPGILGELRRELGRGYDVVHAHVSVVSPLAYAAGHVAKALEMPAVMTFHSVLRHKKLFLRALDAVANLAGSPVEWTGVSELVASQLRDALHGAEVSVLPNGIDLGFWSAGHGAAPVPRSPVTLVSSMRLHRKKRPRALVAAFARAAAGATAPAVLRIMGDGPGRSGLERDVRRLGLDRGVARVELAGWLPADALRAQYAEAHGFVLASTRESFGIAALEAAAAGLPVIAMAEAGCREFLGDEPHVLCADDDALSSAMSRFIAAPPRRWGGPERQGVLRRYDWSAVLTGHEATYGRAIRRVSGAAAVAG
jgi:glycosyltransferase involved in cell wall biosynthesis